jgi:hypothetical protein
MKIPRARRRPATQAAKRLIETVWPVYERLEAIAIADLSAARGRREQPSIPHTEDRSSILISNDARWLRLTMAGDGSDSTVAGAGN